MLPEHGAGSLPLSSVSMPEVIIISIGTALSWIMYAVVAVWEIGPNLAGLLIAIVGTVGSAYTAVKTKQNQKAIAKNHEETQKRRIAVFPEEGELRVRTEELEDDPPQ
jgi:hypothetical protein